MKYSVAALLALFAYAATSSPVSLVRRDLTFQQCPGSAGSFVLQSVSIEPAQPHLSDKTLTVTSEGQLSTTIVQGAKMLVTASAAGQEVFRHEYDMCEEGAKAGVPCPVAPGHQSLKSIMDIPQDQQIPPFLTIHVKAVGTNKDGSQIFCVEGTTKFLP